MVLEIEKNDTEEFISWSSVEKSRNLEKWYCRIYLQVISGETDMENTFMHMGRGEERVRCMERVTWKLTSPYVKWIVNGNLLCGSGNSSRALYQPRGVGWGGR